MKAGVLTAAAIGVAVCALGAEKLDPKAVGAGRTSYLRYCASCHGPSAKGDGPAASALKTPPADLTTLPRKDGAFDAERVATGIDGTRSAPAHGSREMPVWGKVFARTAKPSGAGAAQTEIANLVDYIQSIQAEPGKP